MSVYNLLNQKWKFTTENYQVIPGDCLLINSQNSDSTGSLTITFPDNPKKGDYFIIKDIMYSFDTLPITLKSNEIPLYLDSSSNPVLSCLIKTKGMENEIIYDGSSWKYGVSLDSSSSGGDTKEQIIWQSVGITLVKKANGSYWWFGYNMMTDAPISEAVNISEGIDKIYTAPYGFCIKTKVGTWVYIGYNMANFTLVTSSSPLDITTYMTSYPNIDDEVVAYYINYSMMEETQITDNLKNYSKFYNYKLAIDSSDQMYRLPLTDYENPWPITRTPKTMSYISMIAPIGSEDSEYCMAYDSDKNLYQSKITYEDNNDALNFVRMGDLKVSSFSRVDPVCQLSNNDIIGFPISLSENFMINGWTKLDNYYGLPSIYTIPASSHNFVSYSTMIYVFGAVDTEGFVWQSGYGYAMMPFITVTSGSMPLTKSTFNINS